MNTDTSSLPAHPGRLTQGLTGFERFAVASITAIHKNPLTKYLSYAFTRYVSKEWILLVTGRRIELAGADYVRNLDPKHGILLVANHRTMWDMYVALSVWLTLNDRRWEMYFPVRRDFFYTHPVGWLVNLGISAGGMWPPMSQALDRSGRNAAALAELVDVLDRPYTIVGIHPEGTRNKSHDPRAFLSAKGGVGRVLKACDPEVLVMPFYMDGLSGSIGLEFKRGFARPGPGREPPIRLAFGEPVPASSFDREQTPRVLAREVLERVADLAKTLPAPQPDLEAWPRTKT